MARKPEDIAEWGRAIAPWAAIVLSAILVLGARPVDTGKGAIVTMLFTTGIVAAVADRNKRKEDQREGDVMAHTAIIAAVIGGGRLRARGAIVPGGRGIEAMHMLA